MRLSDWPGYSPRACDRDDGFPADRAVVYTFKLVAPLAAGLFTSRELMTLERQLQQQERERRQQGEAGQQQWQQQQGLGPLAGAVLPADEGELLGRVRGDAAAAVAAAGSARTGEGQVAAAIKGKGKKAKVVTGSLRGLSQGLGRK